MEPSYHLTFGQFCLDVTHGRLWRGGQPIALCDDAAAGRNGRAPCPVRRGSIGIGQSIVHRHPWRGIEEIAELFVDANRTRD